MHASNVVETSDFTNASTSQDDSELSSHASQPFTPPRGRTRYPDTLARVPLHRRGTSKTYERLEDLLREAGYKETRVFTPESERHTDHAIDKHTSSVRGGVGTVVGFLAGLVSRNSSMAREPISSKDLHSQPPSPLAHIKALHPSSSASSYSFNTSPESLRKHSRFHATRNLFPETHGQSLAPNTYIRHQSSSNFSKDAPNAHAYLRHMASAPNIQPLAKRPSSSNVSLRSHRTPHAQPRSSRRNVVLTSDDIIETDDPPPLPRNWMESVAKALLSGVPETASMRKMNSAFSEATNRPKEQRRPPLLCAQVQEQRAGTTEGKVSQTSVVCRSAPASRAGSRVRRTGAEYDESRHRRDDERRRRNKREEELRKGKGKGKGKRKESDMVPSLARTRVENDEWSMSRYPSASHRQEGPCSSSSSSEDVDDDEEDEGELDLERILVPARRQASIRSLRKHLHPPSTAGSLRGLPPTPTTISTTNSTINGQLSSFAPDSRGHISLDDSWGTSRGRRWVVGEEDDDEGDGYGNGNANGALSASEIGGTGIRTRAGMKRRRGLPGAWAQWGG
ncbi:uncharacterized protein HD556DRAFT_1280391 [Suillus plorans]|uniref:Uncharacterized protein n=1 Tax=Suillus plorans TaxID=116603 RepID=A0A9P7A8T6_9AGAM|nr:uncharacterized protein HD556DRAFT_1280391 [Suillus plorans]KAG1784594.1 hypothetical protein HD556DRAFT_1280391 [Suillus plorans]